MHKLRPGFLILALIATVVTSLQIFRAEHERRALQRDLIELSRIKYGLFSVDEWKSIISGIITTKIQEFDFEEGDRQEMREKITGFLYRVVDEFEDNFYEENSKSLGGFFRSSVAGLTGMFNQIRKEVPGFTEQILEFMDNPDNREGVRSYVMSKVTDYTDRTFAEIDYTQYNAVITRYGQPDRTQTVAQIESLLADNAWRMRPYAVVLLALVVIFGVFAITASHITRSEYLLLTLICMVLLAGGVTLPMIDIDARIAEIQFTLLGEPVVFQDQVLFYKSKSILEVTQLMVTQGQLDLFAVGVLILSFSVLFPFAKLGASMLYLYRPRLRMNGVMRFFVFKTGKWSMADVMVVAIFMAFIGFKGIVSEQLRQIQNFASNVEIVGTNESCLQPGFYLFTSFALLSLLVAHRLQYTFRQDPVHESANQQS